MLGLLALARYRMDEPISTRGTSARADAGRRRHTNPARNAAQVLGLLMSRASYPGRPALAITILQGQGAVFGTTTPAELRPTADSRHPVRPLTRYQNREPAGTGVGSL